MALSDQIDKLGHLKDGWDGRGSARPSEAAIATARSIGICPLGNGGVQLELHSGGADVEVEIDPDGKVISVMWAKSPNLDRLLEQER